MTDHSPHVVHRRELRPSLIVFIAAWPTILILQTGLLLLIGTWHPNAQAGVLWAVTAPALTLLVCLALVFDTPSTAHAARAFEVGAIDCVVVKPATSDTPRLALDTAR